MASNPLETALETLRAGESLSAGECQSAVGVLLDGGVPDEAAKEFLTALHRKGESAEELLGAVHAIRERMIPFDAGSAGAAGEHDTPLLDTCGTGGDGAHTVNVSTATAMVLAACGVRVVKHGNRAASGSSGSSDVLEQLGVRIDVELETLKRTLNELGIVFLFAPRFHPGLKGVAPIRRQLPFRTVFNLVGPLCNPASPSHQLVGVPCVNHARRMASALARDQALRRAIVVTGSDGLDEVTLDGPTYVHVVEGDQIQERVWTPEDFGLGHQPAEDLRVSGPAESAQKIQQLLEGRQGPVRQIVLANAAAALWTVEPGALREKVAQVERVLDSGAAARLLERWSNLTGGSP